LEQTGDADNNDASISELKRVVLNRIADLELSKRLETKDHTNDNAPGPADLIPPPLMAEDRSSEQVVDEIQLNELD
jgi:hypothetical protein